MGDAHEIMTSYPLGHVVRVPACPAEPASTTTQREETGLFPRCQGRWLLLMSERRAWLLRGGQIIGLFPPDLASTSASGISFHRMPLGLTGMASVDVSDFGGRYLSSHGIRLWEILCGAEDRRQSARDRTVRGRVRGGAAARPSRKGPRGGLSTCGAACARARAFPANEAARANVQPKFRAAE